MLTFANASPRRSTVKNYASPLDPRAGVALGARRGLGKRADLSGIPRAKLVYA